MNLELWQAAHVDTEKTRKERKKRTTLFYNSHIEEDPEKNNKNPVLFFDFEVKLRKSRWGYGASQAGFSLVEPGCKIKFLTKADPSEKVYNWFAQNLETGEVGFVWTRHKSRGTVKSKRQGFNRKPTLLGKPGYEKYKRLQDIAFIMEDII